MLQSSKRGNWKNARSFFIFDTRQVQKLKKAAIVLPDDIPALRTQMRIFLLQVMWRSRKTYTLKYNMTQSQLTQRKHKQTACWELIHYPTLWKMDVPSIVLDLFLSHLCVRGRVRGDWVPLEEPVNDAAGHDVTCSFWSKPGLVGSVCWYQSWREITTSHSQSPGNLGWWLFTLNSLSIGISHIGA